MMTTDMHVEMLNNASFASPAASPHTSDTCKSPVQSPRDTILLSSPCLGKVGPIFGGGPHHSYLVVPPSRTAYVDDSMLKSGKIARGAILGAQGGIWAISSGFNVSRSSQWQGSCTC